MDNAGIISSQHGLKKIVLLIQSILVLVVLSWQIGGMYSLVSSYIPNFVPYLCFLVWLICAFILKPQLMLKNIIPILLQVVFILYLTSIKGALNANVVDLYEQSAMYMSILYCICVYYSGSMLETSKKRILSLFWFDFTIVAINTLLKLRSNPQLSRLLAVSQQKVSELGLSNVKAVGSYAFAYSLVMLLLYIVYSYYVAEKKEHKTTNLLMFLLLFVTMLRTSFTIAILLFGIFAVYILVSGRNSYKSLFIGLTIVAILIILYMTGSLSAIFKGLSMLPFISDTISVRLMELSMMFSGDQLYGTDLSSRTYLYKLSIDVIREYFSGAISTEALFKIGGHSTILDTIAYFGINSLPFFLSIYLMYRNAIKTLSSNIQKNFIRIVWGYYAVLSLINTTLFSTLFATLIVAIPLMLDQCIGEKSNYVSEVD